MDWTWEIIVHDISTASEGLIATLKDLGDASIFLGQPEKLQRYCLIGVLGQKYGSYLDVITKAIERVWESMFSLI